MNLLKLVKIYIAVKILIKMGFTSQDFRKAQRYDKENGVFGLLRGEWYP